MGWEVPSRQRDLFNADCNQLTPIFSIATPSELNTSITFPQEPQLVTIKSVSNPS